MKKNCQYLWCNTSFQGINDTMDIDHIPRKKSMYIKIYYVPKDKSNITRYQELYNFKQAQKGVLHEYSENTKSSI